MLDLQQAERWYEGRVNRNTGRKVTSYGYMVRDGEDAFLVRALKSRWIREPETQNYRKRTQEEYEFTPIARITSTGIVFAPEAKNYPAMLRRLWGVYMYAPRSKAFSGKQWCRNGKCIPAETVALDANGEFIVIEPSRQRVLIRERMKSFNDKVIRIRNTLRVRNNLGVLDTLDLGDPHTPPVPTVVDSVSYWDLFRDAKKFEAFLDSIDPNNLESFVPLLWVLRRRYGWYSWSNRHAPADYLKQFNKMVDSMREKVRERYQAVEYV